MSIPARPGVTYHVYREVSCRRVALAPLQPLCLEAASTPITPSAHRCVHLRMALGQDMCQCKKRNKDNMQQSQHPLMRASEIQTFCRKQEQTQQKLNACLHIVASSHFPFGVRQRCKHPRCVGNMPGDTNGFNLHG